MAKSPPSSTTASTYPPSTSSDKDIEVGRKDIAHAPHLKPDSFDDAIVRITSAEPDEPEKKKYEEYEHHASALNITRTVSTTRTTKDLEAVIGTPFEVRWQENDPESPLNWKWQRKGWILALVSMQTLIVCVRARSRRYFLQLTFDCAAF